MIYSKTIGLVVGSALLMAALPSVAAEDDAGKSVCLSMRSIDHTDIPDSSTILFYMRNHKVWKAAMNGKCVGLRNNTMGFSYEPTKPGSQEICANFLVITVNDTGERCFVGDITPVEPAPKKS